MSLMYDTRLIHICFSKTYCVRRDSMWMGHAPYTWMRHIAAHCSTLQHTATHCNTLQHTATHCNTRQHMLHIHECVTLQIGMWMRHCPCVLFIADCIWSVTSSFSNLNLQAQSPRSLLPHSIEEKPKRLGIEVERHSKCNRLYMKRHIRILICDKCHLAYDYECVTSHIWLWMCHVTHIWLWMCHVTHIWLWMCHVTHMMWHHTYMIMNVSRHTYVYGHFV